MRKEQSGTAGGSRGTVRFPFCWTHKPGVCSLNTSQEIKTRNYSLQNNWLGRGRESWEEQQRLLELGLSFNSSPACIWQHPPPPAAAGCQWGCRTCLQRAPSSALLDAALVLGQSAGSGEIVALPSQEPSTGYNKEYLFMYLCIYYFKLKNMYVTCARWFLIYRYLVKVTTMIKDAFFKKWT